MWITVNYDFKVTFGITVAKKPVVHKFGGSTMDLMKIYGDEYSGLEKALKHQSTRHNVHASNIANVSTPNYIAKEFNFENSLKEELGRGESAGFLTRTNSAHMQMHVPAKLTLDKTPSGRIDGNNVALDKEMATITQNSIDNNATLAFMKKKMDILKYTIQKTE